MRLQSDSNCPACGTDDQRAIGAKNGFDLSVCKRCASIFTSNMPMADESFDYSKYYSDTNLAVPAFVRRRASEIVAGFDNYRNNNRFLDIGFGAGTFLSAAAERAWEVFGSEVSYPAVSAAEKLGFKVFFGKLTEARFPDEYFDVITASEILEHLEDPMVDLAEIARVLRPGGLFWATTPSSRSLSFRLLGIDWSVLAPPEHVQIYSPKGVAGMLNKAGFKNMTIRTHGCNIHEIINHYKKIDRTVEPFDRNASAFEMNEFLAASPIRRSLKGLLNHSLNWLRLGDSLKIFAKK